MRKCRCMYTYVHLLSDILVTANAFTRIRTEIYTHKTLCITYHFITSHALASNISLFNPTLVPTVPLSLSATAVSSTSIQFRWNQPYTLNGVLHGYKVRYKLSSDSNFGTPISVGTQLTYSVTGLKPFTDYELQVHQFSFESPPFALIGYCGLCSYILCCFLHLC